MKHIDKGRSSRITRRKVFATNHLEKKLAEKGQVLTEDTPTAPDPDWNAPEFRSEDDGSKITGPTKTLVIDGHIVDVPILSENTKGIKNAVMCPACTRHYHKKAKKCTGPIPTCDQCVERGLDAEMCASNDTIKEIRARREREDQEFYGERYGEGERVDRGDNAGSGGGKQLI